MYRCGGGVTSRFFAVTMTPFLATLGTAFGLVGATSLVLQARRLRRLGSACEISIPIRLISVTGYAIWLAYGLAIQDLPLIVVDAAGLAGAVIVLRITVRLRRVRACPVALASASA